MNQKEKSLFSHLLHYDIWHLPAFKDQDTAAQISSLQSAGCEIIFHEMEMLAISSSGTKIHNEAVLKVCALETIKCLSEFSVTLHLNPLRHTHLMPPFLKLEKHRKIHDIVEHFTFHYCIANSVYMDENWPN